MSRLNLFTVTESNFPVVWNYLSRKITGSSSLYVFDYEDVGKINSLKQEFLKISQFERDFSALQSWCDKWLSRQDWSRLQGAVRADRKRAKDRERGNPPVNVHLQRNSYLMLSAIAKRDGVTLSDVIVKYLNSDYKKSLQSVDI